MVLKVTNNVVCSQLLLVKMKLSEERKDYSKMNFNIVEFLIKNILQIMEFKTSDPPPQPYSPDQELWDIVKEGGNIPEIKKVSMKYAFSDGFQEKQS